MSLANVGFGGHIAVLFVNPWHNFTEKNMKLVYRGAKSCVFFKLRGIVNLNSIS